MWPAMWPGYPNPGANFFVDDPDNQRLADEYGIVISTSHHEPMQRLTNEWFLENEEGSWDWETNKESMTDFFRYGAQRAKEYESYFTVGIRGAYDRRMPGSDPAVTITDVIDTQRRIIEDVYGRTEDVPRKYTGQITFLCYNGFSNWVQRSLHYTETLNRYTMGEGSKFLTT